MSNGGATDMLISTTPLPETVWVSIRGETLGDLHIHGPSGFMMHVLSLLSIELFVACLILVLCTDARRILFRVYCFIGLAFLGLGLMCEPDLSGRDRAGIFLPLVASFVLDTIFSGAKLESCMHES